MRGGEPLPFAASSTVKVPFHYTHQSLRPTLAIQGLNLHDTRIINSHSRSLIPHRGPIMLSPSASTAQTEPSTHQTHPTSTSTTITSPPLAAQPTDPHRTSLARTAFTTHLSALASSHLTPLQNRSSDITTNARSLAKQENTLSTKATPALIKEGDKLEKMGEKERGRLKELGDVQNWAEVLERDLVVLETVSFFFFAF